MPLTEELTWQYDASEIGKLLEPILAGQADAVFGSRFAGSERRRVLYYWHSMGNKVLTWIANVLCDLNFLKNDQEALECVYEALEPGGKAIILVPQHPSLFSKLDTSVGHFRRYTVAELSEKVRKAGFEISETRQFNRFAALGWYVSGELMGASHVEPGQIKLMNALMPIAKLVEHLPFWPALQ